MTALVTLSAEEAGRRELEAADAERAAFAAWQEAFGSWEVAQAEYVRALQNDR